LPSQYQGFFVFIMGHTKRDYYCAATSQEEMEEWLRLIRQVLKFMQRQDNLY